MIEEILAGMGLSKVSTIGGFFGSLVSLKFLGELTIWQGATALFSGTMTAAFITPLVLQVGAMSQKTEGAVSFLIGTFGLILGAAIVKELPSWLAMIRDRLGRGV